MPALYARVDLSQDAALVRLDIEQAAGGYAADLTRAREPVRSYDGEGNEVLQYGLGSDRRRLSISGTTELYRLPPVLGSLDLDDDITATLTWADGVTSTTLVGRTAGLERAGSDLLGGAVAWSLTLVGVVTLGLDPVTGETVEAAP